MDVLKVILTAAFSAVVLFVITKLIGRKQLSELDVFDYVTGITIGSIAAEMSTELEEFTKPLVAMIVWGAISYILSMVGNKFNSSRKYINGSPVVIMENGKLIRKSFSDCKLDLSEFLMTARQAGYFDLSQISTAIFEYNGKISFLPFSGKAPATPDDLSLNVEEAPLFRPVILDGEIIHDELCRLGFDEKWLEKEIDSVNLGKPKDIFLGLCAGDGTLTLYPGK